MRDLKGSEVDAEIAEKLFGFRRMSFKRQDQSERMWMLTKDDDWFTEEGRKNVGWAPATPDEKPFSDALRDVPRYSTKIEDAWLVVERITAAGLTLSVAGDKDEWDFIAVGDDGECISTKIFPTAPPAICDLALQLFAKGLLT